MVILGYGLRLARRTPIARSNILPTSALHCTSTISTCQPALRNASISFRLSAAQRSCSQMAASLINSQFMTEHRHPSITCFEPGAAVLISRVSRDEFDAVRVRQVRRKYLNTVSLSSKVLKMTPRNVDHLILVHSNFGRSSKGNFRWAQPFCVPGLMRNGCF